MRKSWKRALSAVLTAAMVVTGAGFTGSVKNATVASAEEGSGSDPAASPEASADASASPEASADASASPEASADVSAAPETSEEPEVIAPAPEEDGYTAFLMDAAVGIWDAASAAEGTTANILVQEGDATYSVSAKNTSGEDIESDNVICVDIPDFATAANSAGYEVAVKDVKLSLDGVDSPINPDYLYAGDIEDKGTYRIQIHNEWGVKTGGEAVQAIADETFLFKDEIKVTFTISLTKTAAKGCTAFLMDSGANVWNADAENAETAIVAVKESIEKPDGNLMSSMYSVSTTNTGEEKVSPTVFCVDIIGLNTELAAAGLEAKVSDVKLFLDDAEVAVDASKLITGDIEDNGNYRIEIYNQYGDTKDAPAVELDKLTYEDEARVTFKVVISKAAAVTPSAAPTEEPASTTAYHVYLGYQTNTYAFRDAWDNDTYGLKSKELDYASEVGSWADGDLVKTKVTIQDAVIDHNGDYTVSISGMDLTASDSETYNFMYLSTDVPLSMSKLKFTNVSLSVDGGTPVVYTKDLPSKKDSKTYYMPLLINDANYGQTAAEYKTSDVGMATKSIEVKFTISGGDFEGTYKTSTLGLKKGKTFTNGNFKYKVTKVAKKTVAGSKTTTTKGKVSIVGLSAKGKKAKALTLGTTVKNAKATYTISALSANAFKGAKATKITLNKNIKKLPKNAFAKCTKLTKLALKAKLTSANKAAFTGCKKTIKVSGTSAAANLKLLKKTSYKKFK